MKSKTGAEAKVCFRQHQGGHHTFPSVSWRTVCLICSRYSIRNNPAQLCQLQAIKLMNLYTSIEHYDRGQATSSVVIQTQGTMGLCKALESWLWVWKCHWEHGQPSLLKDVSLLGITAPSPSASFANKLHVYPLGSIPMSLLPGPAWKDTGPRRSVVSVPLPIPSLVCRSLASCSSSPLAHMLFMWNSTGAWGMKHYTSACIHSLGHTVGTRAHNCHITVLISATDTSGLFLSQVLYKLTFLQMQQKNKILFPSARQLALFLCRDGF